MSQKIIYDWNSTDAPYSEEKIISELFEEQVRKTPNHIAVIYDTIELTYQQLNERANQLANYLKNRYNIKPDTLIALCLDRSEYMLIAILAIFKAGGAYVPIDPSHPNSRITYLLEDMTTEILLTNEKYKNKNWY